MAGRTISNVAPWPLALCTRTVPWWASAMACTMGRPSPNPPASRLRYGSARETAEDAVLVGARDAAAGVGHGDDGATVVEADADLHAVAWFGVRNGVLKQRVQRHDEPVAVTEHGSLGYLPQPPVARHMTPAFQRVEEQVIGGHRRHL